MSGDKRGEARKVLEDLVDIAETAIDSTRDKLKTMEPYVRHVASNVKRDDDGRITGSQWSQEFVERPTWLPLSIWMSKNFERTQEYQNAVTSISKLFGMVPQSIGQWLTSFLLKRLSRGSSDDVELILNDLEREPCTWDVTVEMIGVLPESEIRLAEGITLRPVHDSDLTFEIPLGSMVPLRGRDLMRSPDSIMQISMLSPYPATVQEKVVRLCILLCLFRETCAHYERYRMNPKSFSQFGGTISIGGSQATEPRIILRMADSPDLIRFIQNFELRVPEALFRGNPVDPLEISMKRYLDSVRGNVPIEERLTYAVMGLEALFLENERELSFRLALRVAQVLKYLGETPSTVYSTVSEAYRYRSSHVHGSVLSDQERIRAGEMLKSIWRYLRKAILLWLGEMILSEVKKRNLLKEIDATLIDDGRLESFKGRVERAKSIMKGAI